jgi:hypothetical protein
MSKKFLITLTWFALFASWLLITEVALARHPLPRGRYLNSCEGCEYHKTDHTLRCTCWDLARHTHKVELVLPAGGCRDIEVNDDGKLGCVPL